MQYVMVLCFILLCLLVSPEGSVSAPSIINSQLEETERFICTAMGGPGNDFTWIKIDDMSVIGNTAEINITIDDVLRGGVYECTVTNNAGNDTAQTTLNSKNHLITIVKSKEKFYCNYIAYSCKI